MKKILITGLLILVLILAGLGGYVIGIRQNFNNRLALSLSNYSASVLHKVSSEEESQGYFCANPECTQMALGGVATTYDQNSRLIGLRGDRKSFQISLSDLTLVDSYYGIPYFEQTWRSGDKMVIIFDRKAPLVAAEVYFIKTGSISKKKTVSE